jgi:hypothetical protein
MSLSEWKLDSAYHGDQEMTPYPITMHDVYAQDGVTIKTGNPYMNNAPEEFHRALHARFLGVVEAKSPVGFSFHTEDVYGVNNPGKMFYKHISGQDLESAIGHGDRDLMNWALWETGKFFSRLINARLFLGDANRLANYFIEENPATRVFRFLDMELVSYHQAYGSEKKIEMLSSFMKSALARGFLTPERLGEFVIVCLGAHAKSTELVDRLLALAPYNL